MVARKRVAFAALFVVVVVAICFAGGPTPRAQEPAWALQATKPPPPTEPPPPPPPTDKPPPPTEPPPPPPPTDKPLPPTEPATPPPTDKPPPPTEPAGSREMGTAQPSLSGVWATSVPTGSAGPAASGAQSAPVVITGQVFADLNSDGIQDPGEQGIGGVVLELDGEAVGITDGEGSFSVPLPRAGRALLSLAPPSGWQWTGEPLVVDERVSDVALSLSLQRVEVEVAREPDVNPFPAATVATTAATVTGGVAVLVLVAGLVFNGFASLVQTAAIRAGNRTAEEIGLAQLDAARQRLEQQVEVPKGEEVDRLGRFALEATGEWAAIDQVIQVAARPAPLVAALGKEFAHYVFSTAPPKVAQRLEILGERPRRVLVFTIDASTSGLTAAKELAAIWTNLAEAEEFDVPQVERVLPRTARWYLYVVSQRIKKAGEERPWWRRLPKLVIR